MLSKARYDFVFSRLTGLVGADDRAPQHIVDTCQKSPALVVLGHAFVFLEGPRFAVITFVLPPPVEHLDSATPNITWQNLNGD